MKKQGQAILAVILLINLFLVIALVMVNLMLGELKIQSNLDDSMIAYYAAESGVEKAIFQIKESGGGDCTSYGDNLSSGASYNYSIDCSDAVNAEIRSTGLKDGVGRYLLVRVPKAAWANSSGVSAFWPKSWKEAQ